MLDIRVELTKTPKAKPADESKLGFGKEFSDHMFVMDYDPDNGWTPESFPISPSRWIRLR